MRERLTCCAPHFEDGSLWITIDDNEAHYLKVLCVSCSRANFVANVTR